MKTIFLLLIFLFANVYASPIDFTKDSETILPKSELYIDKKGLDFEQIRDSKLFHKNDTQHINLGFVKDTTLWIKLTFYNDRNSSLEKMLVIRNPLLESVILYDGDSIIKKGMLHIDSSHKHIYDAFKLTLNANETKTYYLKVQNSTTALRLGIYLEDQMIYVHEDHNQQLIIFIFFTIVIVLFIYNFLLFIYSGEKSYLYYCIYLLTLIYQQATYLGVTQIFMPQWFLYYDNIGVVFKVNIIYVAASFFAQSFLVSKKYPLIHKIYNIFIVVAIVEMPLLGTPWFYYPEIAVLTAFSFVIFNMIAGTYIYMQGCKQARFFVIGWMFLAIGYTLMILDALGIITVMQNLSNLILFVTAIEAFSLSLAFTDRYMILKKAKETSDAILVKTLQERQKVIENEIQKHTKDLNAALDNQKVLLKELHHRTKNNLQLILSLVRMQSDHATKDVKEYSENLENRINAIARMHQMLYLKDNLQQINMDEYINELSNDLESLSKKDVLINIEARQIYLPFREASYIGLILNELITNSIKYVALSNIVITIEMHREGAQCSLMYKDNGKCYDFSNQNRISIGLKLVKTLVEDQLEGTISVKMKNGCGHMIEFRL